MVRIHESGDFRSTPAPVAPAEIRKLIGTPAGKIQCTRPIFNLDDRNVNGLPAVTGTCGADVPLHGLHWVDEICPVCLQTFHWGSGPDNNLYLGYGYFDSAGASKVRANIARNDGRYVPFDR